MSDTWPWVINHWGLVLELHAFQAISGPPAWLPGPKKAAHPLVSFIVPQGSDRGFECVSHGQLCVATWINGAVYGDNQMVESTENQLFDMISRDAHR